MKNLAINNDYINDPAHLSLKEHKFYIHAIP